MTPTTKELEFLNKLKQPVIPSGSYFICGTKDTDIDFFTLHTPEAVKHIESAGYSTNMGEKYLEEQGFISYRKGKFNVILVSSEDHLYAIELATYLCTQLCVTDKEKRILVFQVLKAREIPEERDKLALKPQEAIPFGEDSIYYRTNSIPQGLEVDIQVHDEIVTTADDMRRIMELTQDIERQRREQQYREYYGGFEDANRARGNLGPTARRFAPIPHATDPDAWWASIEPATLRMLGATTNGTVTGTTTP